MNYDMGEPHPCFVAEEMRQYDLAAMQRIARGEGSMLEEIEALRLENAQLRQQIDHLEWSVATLREIAERPTWSE